jgi:hypothetical protein
MKLFGPKRTFHSVVRELVDGLEQGTVVLPGDEHPKGLPLSEKLPRLRRLAVATMVCSILLLVVQVGLALYWWPERYPLLVMGTGVGILAALGFLMGYALQQMRVAERQFEEAEEALRRSQEALDQARKRVYLEWTKRLIGDMQKYEAADELSSEAIVDEAVAWLMALGQLPEPLKRRVLGELLRRGQKMAEAAPEG